jgi:hypothetical protein
MTPEIKIYSATVSSITASRLASIIFFPLYGSTALWILAAFQFLDPIHRRYDSLDGGSAHSKAATYTQNNINTE